MTQNKRRIINYQGDLKKIFHKVVRDYNLGDFISYNEIKVGYEDFNVIVKTSSGNYMVKIFASYKSSDEIERNVYVITEVIKHGIRFPKVYKTCNKYLYSIVEESQIVDLLLMEYIPEENLLFSNQKLTRSDKIYLAEQAARINKLKVKPFEIFDQWAVTNVNKLYKEVRKDCDLDDIEIIDGIINEVNTKIDFSLLPKAFIHGDLTASNIIKYNQQIYILDFSVANIAPKIQELSILLVNTIFDPDSEELCEKDYKLILDAYTKVEPLSDLELSLLPLYIKVSYVTNILGIIKTRNIGKSTIEDNYWLNLGKKGIRSKMKLG